MGKLLMWIYMFLKFIILHLLWIRSFMLFEIVLPGSLDKLTVYFCPVLKKRNAKTAQQM